MSAYIDNIAIKLASLHLCIRCILLFIEGSTAVPSIIDSSEQQRFDRIQSFAPSFTIAQTAALPPSADPGIGQFPCQTVTSPLDRVIDAVDRGLGSKTICPCCHNSILPSDCQRIVDEIFTQINAMELSDQSRCFAVAVSLPPVLDLFKVIYRVISSKHSRKSISFPIYDNICKSMFEKLLATRSHGKITVADVAEDSVYTVSLMCKQLICFIEVQGI
jgi:hypothetical protein